MGTVKVKRYCEYCKCEMQVRLADVRRGWGRFCCKSHAALGKYDHRKPAPVKQPHPFYPPKQNPAQLDSFAGIDFPDNYVIPKVYHAKG